MTTTRRIGAVAALVGMIAAIALLTGLSGAYADELADLRANQQILQQELTKLEQAQQLAAGPGARPIAPGTPTIAGSFPRSFLIPGTNTSIAIGGFVGIDAAYWFNGGNPNVSNSAAPPVTGVPSTAGAPLKAIGTGPLAAPTFNPRSRSNGIFKSSASESRLRVETRTPTAWGEAVTVLEGDFFACTSGAFCNHLDRSTNRDVFGLRHAYGTLGPWLIGQTWVPVSDLEAHATLFDFGGEAGNFGFARVPQIRYTGQLPYGLSFVIAAVDPVTEAFTAAGAVQTDSLNPAAEGAAALAVNPTKSPLPDGNFVLKLTRPWGEFSVAAVVHELELQDGLYITKKFVGYGGALSTHVIPFPNSRDNFGFEMYMGDGLGHYGGPATGSLPEGWNALATNYGGASAGFYGTNTPGANTRANAARVLARTITSYGGQANYQHWWAAHWRSTISGGVQYQDVPTTLVGLSPATVPYNHRLWTAHANIIWSPVAFIDTGFEFVHGNRLTIWRQSGSENVLDFTFHVKF